MTRFQRHSFFQNRQAKVYNSSSNPAAKSASQFISNPFHNENEALQPPQYLISSESGVNPLTPSDRGIVESPMNIKTPTSTTNRVSQNFKDIFPELSNIVQKYAPQKPIATSKPQLAPSASRKGWIVM